MARTFVRASSQYLERTTAVVASPPFTISAWGYPNDLTNDHTLVCIAASGGVDRYHLHFAGDVASDPIRYTVTQTTSVNVGINGYASATWQHVAAVETSSSSRALFLNGTKTTNSTSKSPASLDRTSVGRRATSTPADHLDGLAAEVAIWNTNLSDAEITLLALGICPLLVRPGALVAYWPLIGRASPEIDRWGGNDLTVTGATVGDHPRMVYANGLWRPSFAAAVAATSFRRTLFNRTGYRGAA